MKKLLGDVTFQKKSFPRLPAALKAFTSEEFSSLVEQNKLQRVNQTLAEWIQEEPEPCFLLAPVLEFIERIAQEGVIQDYSFNHFELWLNQFSGFSFEENYHIRGKIAGKLLDRSEYTALFPIGLGKIFEGSHFVTAHKSPDLDTTVASFWGWLDAFAARVADGLHLWNVPGGPPQSQIEMDLIFRDLFGPAVFTHLAKNRLALHVTAKDLMSQKGMFIHSLKQQMNQIDHDRDRYAAVLVDEKGFYLGDWRSTDVEGVRDVILLFSSCLRWFENQLNLLFLELFAKKQLEFSDLSPLLASLFSRRISECEPVLDLSIKQREKVADFLVKVLELEKGIETSFETLWNKIGRGCFKGIDQILSEIGVLFDSQKRLIENRELIFNYLEKAVYSLHESVIQIRKELETLEIALKTKEKVFGHQPTYVTLRSDLEEIKMKMGSHSYLTVNDFDQDRLIPVGIIHAVDLRKTILGTVSLRDFCNRDEMTIPSYLEVISVIDHHKSVLTTSTPPFAIISDVQSSNSLVAKQAFIINDRNSTGGLSEETIEKQLSEEISRTTPTAVRLTQKLLRKRFLAKEKQKFFVHPEREFVEYLHFLYAILEDTDLLTKVTPVDVECVVELLNRLKSLSSREEVEILSLDQIPRDKGFAKKSAAYILQNEDLYSLYRKVYEFREKEVALNIELASEGKSSHFFADTKEQNRCCRIGQTKVFARNIPLYEKKAQAIQTNWVANAQRIYQENPVISLHIHMMSTIVSAEDVYQGVTPRESHKDELWIWVPSEDVAIERLKAFLTSFQGSPGFKNNQVEVELIGEDVRDLEQIFKESFFPVLFKYSKGENTIAILRYNLGSLNSRKATVAPFLPTL